MKKSKNKSKSSIHAWVRSAEELKWARSARRGSRGDVSLSAVMYLRECVCGRVCARATGRPARGGPSQPARRAGAPRGQREGGGHGIG